MLRLRFQICKPLFLIFSAQFISAFIGGNLAAEATETWEQVTTINNWPARFGHTALVFDNKIWILGGHNGSSRLNDIWYSSDGIEWVQATAQAPWAPRSGHGSVVFDGRMWVIGGSATEHGSDVASSFDGVTWNLAGFFPIVLGDTCVVYNDRMWSIGGSVLITAMGFKNSLLDISSDIRYSTDGIHWTYGSSHNLWSPRSNHTSLIFKDKMWLISGYNNQQILSDVWSSSDGEQWIQMKAEGGPMLRGAAAAVFENRMWVVGGDRVSGVRTNEVWSSSDGINWESHTYPSIWSPRIGHAALVFHDALYILGGSGPNQDGETQYFTDIWILRQRTGIESSKWKIYH